MTCPTTEALSAYADHMLAPTEQARLGQHLHGCGACQQRLAELAALRQALRSLPSPAPGLDLAPRIEGRLRPRPRRPPPRPRPWIGWLPAGFAAGMALASGVWLGSLLLGGATAGTRPASLARVFDPVPPGGLCAATELCRPLKGLP